MQYIIPTSVLGSFRGEIPLLFDIEYNIKADTSGPSKIGRIELYYTKNGGTTWDLYGHDPDLASPVQFRAPGEGVYGFKVVAVSRAGKAYRVANARLRPVDALGAAAFFGFG